MGGVHGLGLRWLCRRNKGRQHRRASATLFMVFFFSSSARALEGMGRDESARMHWYDVMEDAREAGTEWETLG